MNPNLRVFEYGCGFSTLWWSSRVRSVVSCENDEEWACSIRNRAPANVTVLHRPIVPDGEYASESTHHLSDIIVIDGRDRVNCAKRCLPGLSDTGVIIWDKSDRERYQDGYEFLTNNGFRRLDFYGIGPVNFTTWCTSIFYRSGNCLGI